MIEIAICDDEMLVREQLAELAEKQGNDCNIEQFATGNELLAEMKHFDMIFLDIQMEGKNGIETAREIRKYDERAVIIFVTAIKEYVFQAFDVRAFHYLLKPISKQKFAEVFAGAREEIEEQHRKQSGEDPILFIKGRKRSITLKQRDILYIESQSNKVVLHTGKGEIEAWQSIKRLEGKLENNFYRCHRGYLVNMDHITEYSSSMIDMDNGEQVYLSKEKYPEFVKVYMRYLDNGGMTDA